MKSYNPKPTDMNGKFSDVLRKYMIAQCTSPSDFLPATSNEHIISNKVRYCLIDLDKCSSEGNPLESGTLEEAGTLKELMMKLAVKHAIDAKDICFLLDNKDDQEIVRKMLEGWKINDKQKKMC